jgi:hypothetical protein
MPPVPNHSIVRLNGVQARYQRVARVTDKSGSARLFARENLEIQEKQPTMWEI